MRKLMWFCIGFTLSCVIGIYLFSIELPLWPSVGVGILSLILILLRFKTCRLIGALLLGLAVGSIWLNGYDALYLQPAKQFDGQKVSTSIEISDYSYSNGYGCAADGRIQLDGHRYHVRIYFDTYMDLKPGDQVYGDFTISLTIPDGDEESEYYQGKGIFLIANAEKDVSAQTNGKVPAKYYAAKLRRQIVELLNAVFPEDVLGFVRALLIGDSSLLTYEEDTAFKVSGIRHVIAVSGLHVSILFALVYAAVGRHRVWTSVVGIPVLVLFAAIAGFTPSIIRACVMQSLMMLALLLEQEYDPPTALSFAVLVMLLINPMTITSVSFQLSVGCMLGIFLFSGRVNRYLLRKLGNPAGKTVGARFARWFAGSISVTLSAMAVTTPLVAWYFDMVSIVSVITNLMTLWVVSAVFYGIMLACVCGALWLPLGKAIAWIISWAVRYILFVAKSLAALPFAAVYTCSRYVVLWIFVCYLLFAVFMMIEKKYPILLLGCMSVCLCVSLAASYIEPRLDDFRLTVFDVGEGQSILVQNAGKYYLVDCGGSSGREAADIAAEMLLSQGVTKLDGLILTHYDADHVGGVQGLLSRVNTTALYLPDIADSGNTRTILTEKYGDCVYLVQMNVCFDILTLIPAPAEGSDGNESSLCVLFQPENCDILITGDRGKSGEAALLESFDLPKLELLIAGHHGSANSTGFELLSRTMPDGVVISTGGRYGHPAEEMLDRLELFGCNIWRTDQDGTIVFRR